jgi:hypothetical protein
MLLSLGRQGAAENMTSGSGSKAINAPLSSAEPQSLGIDYQPLSYRLLEYGIPLSFATDLFLHYFVTTTTDPKKQLWQSGEIGLANCKLSRRPAALLQTCL